MSPVKRSFSLQLSRAYVLFSHQLQVRAKPLEGTPRADLGDFGSMVVRFAKVGMTPSWRDRRFNRDIPPTGVLRRSPSGISGQLGPQFVRICAVDTRVDHIDMARHLLASLSLLSCGRGSSCIADFDDPVGPETSILAFPGVWVAGLVCKNPGFADAVVVASVIMPINPEFGLPALDQFAEVGDECWRELAAPMLWLDRTWVRGVMGHHYGRSVMRLRECVTQEGEIEPMFRCRVPGHEPGDMIRRLAIMDQAMIVHRVAGIDH